MLTTLYNSFINRYLRGDVESAFPCTAYVLNSNYADLNDTKYYLRNINEFNTLSANSLGYAANVLTGSFLTSGHEITNTYYRDLALDEETRNEPLIISDENLSAFSGMLTVNGVLPDKYKQYIDKYYYFYFVRRNDEFISLSKRVKDLERYVVVLGDDIDNVVVNGSVFGNSETHPFRGVFDGNGYKVAISTINANKVSNGLFGYIAEEGTVKNTIITHSYQTDKLSVISTSEISLNTIKQGKGDFKYGILAGTNYGTVENVFLNADIEYNGAFRPSVYFIQNKAGYDALLSDAWKRLVSEYGDTSDILQKSPELSDFTNICFPTQLCLNSKANIIPYVGYFNEGVFADTFGDFNGNDMYASDNPITLSDTSRDYTSYSQSYDADVYRLYLYNHSAVNADGEGTRYYEGNYTLRPWGNSEVSTYEQTTKGAFRLGPNDKAAYLIGNLVGFNGGTLKNIVSESTATFTTNTVALIGGIAGRDAGGKLDNVKVCTMFKGTTGLYDDIITVQNPNLFTAHASASFLMNNVLSATTLTIPYKGDGGDTTTTLDVSTLSNTIGTVLNTYDIKLRDTIGRACSRDTISGDLIKDGDLYKLAYSGSNITGVSVEVTNGTITVTDISISNTILEVTGANTICNVGRILNTKNEFSAVSAVNLANDTVEYLNPTITENIYMSPPVVQINYDVVYYTDPQHNSQATASLTTTAELNGNYDVIVSALVDIGNDARSPELVRSVYNDKNTSRQELNSESLNLRLFPILNIGGMFGEYVYSNGQDVRNCRSELYADGFKNVSGVSAASVNEFNVISLFASNLTFDSSLKSNPDFYTDNINASADTKITNVLNCTVQTTDPAEIKSKYLRNCDDIISSGSNVGYSHYINCYNQIAPALVTTNGALVAHHENTNRIPDIGLQYNDQLFFEVGLNMGPEYEVEDFDMAEFLAYSTERTDTYTNGSQTVHLSGRYFNYPAQVSSCTIEQPEQLTNYANNNKKSYNAWFYDRIFNTVYDTGNSTANSTAYVSKQLLINPSHYPLYRSRASLFYNSNTHVYKASIALSDYAQVVLRVPVEEGTYEKQEFGEASDIIVDAKQTLCSQLDDLHVDNNVPSYTYSYTSVIGDYTTLKQIPVLVKYNPNFFTFSDSNINDRTVVVPLGTNIEDAIMSASNISNTETDNTRNHKPSIKNYTIESESYKGSVLYGAQTREVDINTERAGVIQLDTIKLIEHEHSTNILDIKLTYPSNYDIIFNDATTLVYMSLKDKTGQSFVIPDYYYMKGDKDTDSIKVTVTHPFSNEHTYDVYESERTSVGSVVYEFTAVEHGANDTLIQHPMSAVMKFDVELKKETVFQESTADEYTPLSANSLVYSFIPTSGDIVKILNDDASRTFTCNGLSADDMRYILLVDDEHRPILDIALDSTACGNDGYIVKFEPRLDNLTTISVSQFANEYYGQFRYFDDASCGRLINIENGND